MDLNNIFPTNLKNYFYLSEGLPVYEFPSEEFYIDGEYFEKGISNNDHDFYYVTNFKIKFTELGFDLSIKLDDDYLSKYYKSFDKNLAYSEKTLRCEIKDSQTIKVEDYEEYYGSGGPGIGYWEDDMFYFHTYEISNDNFIKNDDFFSLPYDCPDLFLAKLRNENIEKFMNYKNGNFFLGASWDNRNSAYKEWSSPNEFSLPRNFLMFLERK